MCYKLILWYKYAIIPLLECVHMLISINILISTEHWLQKDHYFIKIEKQKTRSIGLLVKNWGILHIWWKNDFLRSFPWCLTCDHTPSLLHLLILVAFLIDKIESPQILLRACSEGLASFGQEVGNHFLWWAGE